MKKMRVKCGRRGMYFLKRVSFCEGPFVEYREEGTFIQFGVIQFLVLCNLCYDNGCCALMVSMAVSHQWNQLR